MSCAHEDFEAEVDVHRLVESEPEVRGLSADVRIRCRECGEPMVFVGAPVGLLPSRPTINVDGTELRAPLRPQSADPHFGMGLPGFAARIREGDGAGDN